MLVAAFLVRGRLVSPHGTFEGILRALGGGLGNISFVLQRVGSVGSRIGWNADVPIWMAGSQNLRRQA